jgi:hypothetical protein
MPAKPKEKESLTILIERGVFPRNLYFNRYELEPFEDKNVLAHFGLVVGTALVGKYSCVMTKRLMDQHREGTLNYLGRIPPAPPPKDVSFRPTPDQGSVDVPLVMVVGYTGELAEISFYNFAFGPFMTQPSDSTQASPVALLRSSLGVQRKFIEDLFAL